MHDRYGIGKLSTDSEPGSWIDALDEVNAKPVHRCGVSRVANLQSLLFYFLNFLAFLCVFAAFSLFFWGVFPFFSKDFWGVS